MDFSNERYVRLYTRDTVTWKRLQWDGQNCLSQLLRKADRAGVIDLDGIEPWEAAVVLCGAPEEAARRGVGKMLELGVVVHDGDRLVFPRYIEANECAMSDKQRAKESRAKRAVLSRNVTAPSRNDTEPSHAVTDGHSASHGVTPCRAVPSVPSRAEPEERERARPEGSDAVVRIRDHWADQPLESLIRTEFQKLYEQHTQSIPNQAQLGKAAASLSKWLTDTARLRDALPTELLRKLLEGFFANDRARGEGFPPAFLAANPMQYLEPRKSQQGGVSDVDAATEECRRLQREWREAEDGSTAKAALHAKWGEATERLKAAKARVGWTG